MQLPQSPLQVFNLPLIVNLLPLSKFQRFQHLFHFIQRVLQFLDNRVDLFDGVGDRAGSRRGFRFPSALGFFNGGRGRFLRQWRAGLR